ncbi:hypothetical protein MUG91_G42n247 [Manis pentadactyla]|nr:hypothetical protein MUG91_G42n247 [Manis pentadactyla]
MTRQKVLFWVDHPSHPRAQGTPRTLHPPRRLSVSVTHKAESWPEDHPWAAEEDTKSPASQRQGATPEGPAARINFPLLSPAPDTPPSVATWGPHPTYAHLVLKRDNGYEGLFLAFTSLFQPRQENKIPDGPGGCCQVAQQRWRLKPQKLDSALPPVCLEVTEALHASFPLHASVCCNESGFQVTVGTPETEAQLGVADVPRAHLLSFCLVCPGVQSETKKRPLIQS